ncbi:MAG: hypothetical protein M2R45_02981 [Verrucomicrobia subdivision 3 bacterium]|nr:hypothetical protein [Limisphaerales bacterium]MCS1416532.1 hypothetical protein [Limisphaerales bacterium]
MAAFFLFDGEEVSAFAKREMAAQVSIGIEGLLGIPILRQLAEVLCAYMLEIAGEKPVTGPDHKCRFRNRWSNSIIIDKALMPNAHGLKN